MDAQIKIKQLKFPLKPMSVSTLVFAECKHKRQRQSTGLHFTFPLSFMADALCLT